METIQNFPEITKKDFPLLNKNLKSSEQIIYLDHAATTQKPIQVLEKINEYYRNFNANVHRGAHQLSAKATEEFENARYLIAYLEQALKGSIEGSNEEANHLVLSLIHISEPTRPY